MAITVDCSALPFYVMFAKITWFLLPLYKRRWHYLNYHARARGYAFQLRGGRYIWKIAKKNKKTNAQQKS